jgi:exodeoxyribonuclease V alpha subunit
VDHIIFRNPETGYTVCVLKDASGGHKQTAHPVTVVGNCAAIWDGETMEAEGQWRHHKAHGPQFHASKIVCSAPTSPDGIRRYLGSGMIDGIGPVLAERLVKKFGTQTLDIIERESARLETVEGIGRKRRAQIKAAWNDQKAVRDIMIFLHTHGIGTAQANRIYRAYGEQSINLIRENPYRLSTDIWGIGFKTADRIARSIGIPADSIHRAAAGIIHTLQTMADEGHCYADRNLLVEETTALLEVPTPIVEQALTAAIDSRAVSVSEDRIYLPPLYQAEIGVVRQLNRLREHAAMSPAMDYEKALDWAMARMRLKFAPAQRQALMMALTEKVSLITGGPGVGKTTIIKAVADIWHVKKLQVRLTAPTGRAAKRMEEATAHPAMTIHRLLKYRPGSGFEHDTQNPLPGDVFILDETSMADIALMHSFLRALPGHARLVMVGDADQLPSVGPGNVLRDLLESGTIPSVKLERIFRQHDRSWIVHNAHRVNDGQMLELPGAGALSDFYFVSEDDPTRLAARAVEFAARRIPARFRLNPRTEIQLLSPMRRNQLGADAMNLALQSAINPKGPALQHNAWTYRLGDRVMQLRNNYDKNVYNGDIGFIVEVDTTARELTVDFDGQPVSYKAADLDELSLAYACSIHKSQGSEYPAVIILIATQHFHMLQRNLLYTAITRGRRLVCLMGSRRAVEIAIRNNKVIHRRTGLCDRLRG